ncbi:MAG: sigma-70 family RNA polymerase sigma factor [Pirellulaceae bacterium]
MPTTSLSLLARARHSSDSESWNRLAALYTPLLRRWLRTYDVQDADADDLIQEVLAVVARDLATFDHHEHHGAFRGWLRRILVNRLREHWRRRNYQPEATGRTDFRRQLEELVDEGSGASGIWNREHDEFVMKRLLEIVEPQFEPGTWRAFRRQVIDGQRADAVAEELGMSRAAVYMAKSRVLQSLRRESAGLIDL